MTKTTVEERNGQTVIVSEVTSPADAARIAAEMAGKIHAADGGMDGMAARLDDSMRGFGNIGRIIERPVWAVLAWLAFICAAAIAARAWPSFLHVEGLGLVAAGIGIIIVFCMKIGANSAAKAIYDRDHGEAAAYIVAIVLGLVVNAGASTFLQAGIAAENSEMRAAMLADIQTLKDEESLLRLSTMNAPTDRRPHIAAKIEQIRAGAAANAYGDTLNKSVGSLIGDCTDTDSYYVRTYCPTILALQGDLEAGGLQMEAYADKQARLSDVAALIKEASESLPPADGAWKIVKDRLSTENKDLAPFIAPVGTTALLEILMMLFAAVSGWLDRKRHGVRPAAKG